MNDMPPAPPMPPMGPEDPSMQEPPMEPDEGGMEGEDSEGGVGSDVKKYSGELSQALNTYNEENPSDEEKLNKYAINMIAAQVANSLSDKDKRNVIKKLNGNEDDMSSDEQPQENEPMPQMEGKVISELSDELMDRKGKRHEKYITNKKVTKHNPFVSNR